MKISPALALLLASTLALSARAADPSTGAAISKPALPASSTGPSVDSSAQNTPPPAPVSPTPDSVPTTPKTDQDKDKDKADPTLLPKVEVNKSRINDLDIQINEKQRAIDREKQQSKPTRLDNALNGSKVSKALSIFGGSSSDDRAGLAGERARILQEEKEVLEAMKTAQSKEEKDELKQELEILRQIRRDLDATPR